MTEAPHALADHGTARPLAFRSSKLLLFSATLTVTTVDLASKAWATSTLEQQSIDLPGPLDLRLGHNTGVAFSFLASVPPAVIVALTSILAVTLLIAAAQRRVPVVPVALIAGGAIGNIIDRIDGGSVVDMFYTRFWPTFNVADIAITSGVIVWLHRYAQ